MPTPPLCPHCTGAVASTEQWKNAVKVTLTKGTVTCEHRSGPTDHTRSCGFQLTSADFKSQWVLVQDSPSRLHGAKVC